MLEKRKRIVDPKVVEAVRVRDRYCQVCGSPAVEIHHIKSRGARGDDLHWNLIGLCRTCHTKVHALDGLTPDDLRRILRRKYGFQYDDLAA